MKQPEFKFWPWGVLAASVPLMGVLGVFILFNNQPGANYEQNGILAGIIFFSAIASGNAYVLALATGDFGRSLLAMPVGALAAFVCVHALSQPLVMLVYVVITASIFTRFVYGIASSYAEGGAVTGTSICAGIIYGLVLFGLVKDNPFAVVAGYAGVCGCVGAAMATTFDRAAIVEGSLVGMEAGVLGMTVGGAAGGCTLFAVSMIGSSLFAGFWGVTVGTVCANIVFIKLAMLCTIRIEVEPEVESSKAEDVEKPQEERHI